MIERPNQADKLDINTIEKTKVFLGPTPAICNRQIQGLCRLPYPDHPQGCPNFNHRIDCPPHAPYFPDTFQPNIYLLLVGFDFASYLSQKQIIHPDWTQKALRNPRHWQGHLRHQIRQFAQEIYTTKQFGNTLIYNPEALGIDLTSTLRNNDINLEWPPKNIAYQIAIIADTL